MSSHSNPTRTLPYKPSLAQLRKQTKELLRACQAREALAIIEVEQFERNLDPAKFTLADAMRVLARAYGFSSWNALKNHVESLSFSALIAAAEAGDVAAVERLAMANPKLFKPHLAEFRDSALHRAVLRRDEKLTCALMQLGADARTGFWPHREATSAYSISVDREYQEIVATIEREEAIRRERLRPDGEATSSAIDDLLATIAIGQHEKAIGMLQKDAALINSFDLDGITPLHVAAWMHETSLVRWLLDQEASSNVFALCADPVQRDRASTGSTPLDFASIGTGLSSSNHPAKLYFMENADFDPQRFVELAKMLLDRGAELTPRAAVALGDQVTVRRLHREGKLANEIHLFRGGLIAIAVRCNRIDMLRTLLELGLDPNELEVTDDGARSWGMPLWFASMCGRHEMAELLLARGADVNGIVYACGDSLCMAADERMESLLYKHGAQLAVEQVTDLATAKSILDGTAKAYSLNIDNPTRQDLAEILIGNGCLEFVQLCLPLIARKNDDSFWTKVLLQAAMPEALELVLAHGVDPNAVDDAGYSALHHLATDYGKATDEESRVLRAKILLEGGASFANRDRILQSTPLGWACRWGRIELVRLYLDLGADPMESEAHPWAKPLAWAMKRGHTSIVELIGSEQAT